MMKVLILGCGPAGLFAASAIRDKGHEVVIASKPRKSFMNGAQYLHRPIPGLSTEHFEITYKLIGSTEGYRAKVYGEDSDIDVSPDSLAGTHKAWDIREAYDAAWFEFGSEVLSWDFRPDRSIDRMASAINPDVVISTIPAKLLCRNPEHEFESAQVWSTDSVERIGGFSERNGQPAIDNLVLCSGMPDDWWYRASRIQGYENTEYPAAIQPRNPRRWIVEKPIKTDCDCYPGIERLGRYGSWKKGVLAHESYFEALGLVS